ncbi:MAG: hypothetical protein R3E84_04060 [Pseudomonadales bacterium]
MRNILAMTLMLVAMTIDSVNELFPTVPRQINYVVDALIALLTVVVVVRLIVRRTWTLIPAKYMVVLALFVYLTISGLLLNDVSGDITIAGIRMYFRYVPVFLIPFAFEYSDEDRASHMRTIFWLMLAQLPVTIYQRFVAYSGIFTGDRIVGMYGSSTTVSLLACIGILFVLLAYLRNRIGAGRAILVTLLLLIPPSLAETKVTPIALSLGAAVIIWLNRDKIGFRRMMPALRLRQPGFVRFHGFYSLLYKRVKTGSRYF